MSLERSFVPDLPFGLLQGIRLAHALMETRFEVCIPEAHASKFSILRAQFGARFRVGDSGSLLLNVFRVDHAEPLTSVGNVRRPLIFPHAVVRHCRRLWPKTRPHQYVFPGLVTDKRESAIVEWVRRNEPITIRDGMLAESARFRAIQRIRRSANLPPGARKIRLGSLTVWSSQRGRVFPWKVWDQRYFDILARSKFVLCPNGDYVWSYRFFEAILCGAIPVVEQDSPAYKGFLYHRLDEPALAREWDGGIAEENFARCIERITVPVDELNLELERLLRVQ